DGRGPPGPPQALTDFSSARAELRCHDRYRSSRASRGRVARQGLNPQASRSGQTMCESEGAAVNVWPVPARARRCPADAGGRKYPLWTPALAQMPRQSPDIAGGKVDGVDWSLADPDAEPGIRVRPGQRPALSRRAH